MKKAIQIDGNDNVATVTSDMEAGETVEVLSPDGEVIGRPEALSPVPFGHKLALVDFERGDRVVKYGEVIGAASRRIGVGEWVHVHNVESATVPTSAYREN
ncbi:MAG: UxaA family hydrolase [Candidatus Bathyarchaeota archaeon]|nr:UxaA family hydrolase [Candidatus Bathyarchaeota archaeon]MDH5791224.1 UxaA family hydrolase [Candidatus Bathyarchaeota archaeon]